MFCFVIVLAHCLSFFLFVLCLIYSFLYFFLIFFSFCLSFFYLSYSTCTVSLFCIVMIKQAGIAGFMTCCTSRCTAKTIHREQRLIKCSYILCSVFYEWRTYLTIYDQHFPFLLLNGSIRPKMYYHSNC